MPGGKGGSGWLGGGKDGTSGIGGGAAGGNDGASIWSVG